MKKRHVTELTGEELQSAFRAAVNESWDLAARNGQPVYGSFGESDKYLRQPDGTFERAQADAKKTTLIRKTKAA